MKYELKSGRSISFCSEWFEANLKEAMHAGLDSIDFDIAGAWRNREAEKAHYAHLTAGMRAVRESGIHVNGIHLSFGPNWDISSPDEEKYENAMRRMRDTIARTEELGAAYYIIHGSFEPISAERRALHMDALKRGLRELSTLTNSCLCVETLPRTCLLNTSKEAIDLIDDLQLSNVKICADVNHFLQEKAEDALLAMGERVKTLHISDHDYVDERHWLPGKGKIDWMALIGALEKIGYNGIFHYESAGSMQEIKQNYEELFARYNEGRV